MTKDQVESLLHQFYDKRAKSTKQSHKQVDSSPSDSSDLDEDSDTENEVTFAGKQSYKSHINGHLKTSQKDKIWSFKYVPLHTILPPSYSIRDEERDYEDIKLQRTPDSGQFKVKSSSKRERELSFKEWNDGYDVLASTIIEQYPEKAQGLIKYRMEIRHAYVKFKGNNWLRYDETFRRKHASIDSDWGVKDTDEWMNIFTGEARDVPAGKGRGKKSSVGTKQTSAAPAFLTCHNYNKGLHCAFNPCRFNHVCETCRGDHPAVNCQGAMPNYGQGGNKANRRPAGASQHTTSSGVLPNKA